MLGRAIQCQSLMQCSITAEAGCSNLCADLATVFCGEACQSHLQADSKILMLQMRLSDDCFLLIAEYFSDCQVHGCITGSAPDYCVVL